MNNLKVVDDSKTPHTLVLEFAITAFVPTRAALEAAGAIGGFFCPVPGVGLVADYLSAVSSRFNSLRFRGSPT